MQYLQFCAGLSAFSGLLFLCIAIVAIVILLLKDTFLGRYFNRQKRRERRGYKE